MKIWLTRPSLIAAALSFGFAATTTLPAQEGWEWDPQEGYHEEEWYDPSDWFDDDSTIDYEYDYDWNDYGWDDDYYGWGYYSDYYDPYGYYYANDYWYGDDWYGSDYWNDYSDTYGPDWVYLEDDDWVWDKQQNQWVRWSDMKDRGQNRQNQRQDDRRNQQGNRSQEQRRREQSRRMQQQGAEGDRMQGRGERGTQGSGRLERRQHGEEKMETLNGKLQSFSTVNLKGQRDEHTIVRVKLQDGETRLVNMGPKNQFRRLDVQRGDEITVQGRCGQIGDRSVLMATRIKAGGETAQVRAGSYGSERSRTGQQGRSSQGRMSLVGEIDDWKKMKLGNGDRRDHLFVRIELDDGRKEIVNFGPNTELRELDLDSGSRISVRGMREKVNGRDVLFARDVRVERQRVPLDWQPDGSGNRTNRNRDGYERSGDRMNRNRDRYDDSGNRSSSGMDSSRSGVR